MKIEKVDLPFEVTDPLGLSPIKMQKLGKVVLVAGKNGSGKSRLLKLLQARVNLYKDEETLDRYREEIKDHEQKILSWQNIISRQARRTDLLVEIGSSRERIRACQNILKNNEGIIISPTILPNHVINFVPTHTKLPHMRNISIEDYRRHADKITTVGIDNISNSTIPAIENHIKRWLNVQSPGSGLSDQGYK